MGYEISRKSVTQYCKSLQSTLMSNQEWFNNPYNANAKLSVKRVGSKIYLGVGEKGFFHPGEEPPESPILQLKDGSFFTIAMTFEENKKVTVVEQSVVRYVKVCDNKIQYVIHYDYVEGVENHANHHLQISYDRKIMIPRFDINNDFIGFAQLLKMVIRDLYIVH